MEDEKWIVYSSPNFVEFASKFGRVRNIKRSFFENNNPNLKIEEMDWVTPNAKKNIQHPLFLRFHQYDRKKSGGNNNLCFG